MTGWIRQRGPVQIGLRRQNSEKFMGIKFQNSLTLNSKFPKNLRVDFENPNQFFTEE